MFGRDLTGREGRLVEYALFEDSPALTDLEIPVFQVGRHQIAGFECWWEPILRKSTVLYLNALLDALEAERNKPERLDWCIQVRNAIYHVCTRGPSCDRLKTERGCVLIHDKDVK